MMNVQLDTSTAVSGSVKSIEPAMKRLMNSFEVMKLSMLWVCIPQLVALEKDIRDNSRFLLMEYQFNLLNFAHRS